MNTRQHTAGLAVVSLTLLLAACGGGTADPPLVGTPVTSTADSGTGSLRDLLGSAKDGDTLRLASGTVTLAGPLKVTKSVTIDLGSSVIDAAGKGRTLEIPNGVTVTIKGGTLKGGLGQPIELSTSTPLSLSPQALSQATYGGVISNRGNLTLDGTSVTSGKAMNGGGIYNATGATLLLKNVNVTANQTFYPTPYLDKEPTGAGGGVFNDGTLTLESGNISGNTADFAGGGIRSTGKITISGGHVDNNLCTFPLTVGSNGTSGSAGGGISTFNDLTISGGSVSGNSASYFGGGIASQRLLETSPRPVVTVSGGSLENNKTTGDKNTGGGAIWTNQILNIIGGSIKGNSSDSGGGITSFGDLTISGGSIESNAADRYGGGVLVTTNARSFQMTGGTMRGNTAGINGGAMNFDGVGSITGGVIENNTAKGGGGGVQLYAGAGRKTTFTLGGTVMVRGNTAQRGGGFDVGSAEAGGTTLNMNGGTLTANKARLNGGGINLGSFATLNLSGGSITGNEAVESGGGLIMGGTVNMTGGEITGNRATGTGPNEGGGGGVRTYFGSVMRASGGKISNNTALYGGGVLIGGAFNAAPASQFTLAGAVVSGNQATDVLGDGGGFFNDGKLTIESGSVTGNTARNKGGGIRNTSGATYTQPGGSVTGNMPDNVATF